MGPSDPPGTPPFPGRENLHGLFTINLGVYVPEVARHVRIEAKTWIQEYNCCVQARLGETPEGQNEIWWHARADEAIVVDIRANLETSGFHFFNRFESRDRILAEWKSRSETMGASHPPRIVMAIILAERGERKQARDL